MPRGRMARLPIHVNVAPAGRPVLERWSGGTLVRWRATSVRSGITDLMSPARRQRAGAPTLLSWRKWLMRRIRYLLGYQKLRISRILRVISPAPRITRLSWHHAAHRHRASPPAGDYLTGARAT